MSNTDPTTNVSGIDCLMRHRIPSRPFNFYLGFGLPLIGMLWLLLVDPSGIDFRIANWMYQPGVGFIGRSSWFLENILHDRAKQAVILFAVCAIAGLVASFFVPHSSQALSLAPLASCLRVSGARHELINRCCSTAEKAHSGAVPLESDCIWW